MLSKMITDRTRDTDSVVAALSHLGPKLATQAEELLGPYLNTKKGETMPDLGLLATLVVRLLTDRAGKMTDADSAHNAELADDAEPRQERDENAQALYSALVDVKQGASTLFGETWVGKLKIPAVIPQDPATLSRVVGDVSEAIAKAEFPKPRLAGVKSFDRQPWIAQINAPTKALAKAIKDVAREAREAQATLIEKTRAVAAYDDAFSKGVAIGAALLRLVGEPEHASRLRPSARKPGTLATEEEVAAEEVAAEESAEIKEEKKPQ